MKGRVLIAAGSDSGGGAGIQADIKAVSALGGYAATAITALTAQNTQGVFGIHAVPPDFVTLQIDKVLGDIGADCIKTGMLASVAIIEAVADGLERFGAGIPRVVDPVMVAKGGASLLADDATQALINRLVAGATLITPNIPEAEVLLGRRILGAGDMEAAARDLLALGPQAVLLKGGHLDGDDLVDLLAWSGGTRRWASKRIHTSSTHGTGCTLASAIACSIAQGLGLEAAVDRARAYVLRAIETAPGLGSGHGPLNHMHTIAEFTP
ncbi:bifunctional hydroxymethylpyrimidine kinase/phosphomethylpyrimidine kinase [Magnetospirillum moscoviense]|uniref:hydroxymethylpyrimidine kinase n=1 Tax=Magnetospirillum moscoviense TaxID=1437059 RepID=A0A178N147_9PROT|nr:bifunctional hydroxymethylpyrimidine kinase/phosphomethylpyrimidine kinase [Magnetospirillum moscoviense]MBF0323618.1 bifunctional hydroxymethylpyrimidine kinase/phosphomethylpyrimidine kinase [Alphaproteobacteria bacterium]OAN64458.1 hydroxymethylpyrimidine/phosphomethylpyrimidine kinase [Magnetospirillum moscoviense]